MTAIYVRLSRDDGNLESNSIAVQKQMLTAHAESQGLLPYKIYADDGWSGTTLDRPAFQELAEDIEQGRIKTVMCKDTSRLGRNYLAVGAFMEMLSLRGIRLISLSDAIDTINGEDEFSPFRNLMAEWYARDISKKIKASKMTAAKNGKVTNSQAPYGYKYVGDNTWEIVEEQAEIVRRVFAEYLRGFNYAAIAESLNADGIPTATGTGIWKSSPISLMINNRAYAGDLVQMKWRKPSFKSKSIVRNAPENEIITLNHHPPIIEREQFEMAEQRSNRQRQRRTSMGEMPPLNGYVFCAECGGKMYYHRSRKRDTIYTYLACIPPKTQTRKTCPNGMIKYTALEQKVLADVVQLTRTVQAGGADFVSAVERMKRGTVSVERERKKAEKRIAEIDKIITALYADKVGGVITAERFAAMLRDYESEQQAAMKKLSELANRDSENGDWIIKYIKNTLEPESLTIEIVSRLIKRIEVDKEKRIVIEYNILGQLTK